MASTPGGWDDVDFALGIREYDLWEMQPHFPGYPVYMIVARLVFGWWNVNAITALSWFSAVSSALSVGFLYYIVVWVSGWKIAAAVCLLWCVDPLSWVLGTQPLSDSFGCLLVLAMLSFALSAADDHRTIRGRTLSLLVCGIMLGLLLGVRLSYVPFAIVLLWAGYRYGIDTGRWWKVIQSALVTCLTMGLWLYALIRQAGSLDGLWRLSVSFTAGHFSDWGGAYQEGEAFWGRLWYWLSRQFLAAGLGTPWPHQSWAGYVVLVMLLFACLGAGKRLLDLSWRRFWDRSFGFIIAWSVPYTVWAFFAQNIDKPRHILPLIPLLLWFIVLGLRRFHRAFTGFIALVVLTMSMLAVGFAQVADQRSLASPMDQLALYLSTQNLQQSGIVYTYEEERVIHYRDPSIPTVRLRKFEDFRISLLNQPILPERVLVTDKVLSGFQRPEIIPNFRKVAQFTGNFWLYPTYHHIVLYELKPEKAQNLLEHTP